MLDAIVKADATSREFFSYEITESGASLSKLSDKANTYISAKTWGAVILQEYSNLPMLDYEEFRNGVNSLILDIRRQESQPIFFMTWAYRSQPNMLPELKKAYIRAGNEFDGLVVPVGIAFSNARAAHPSISLYSDDKHPSLAGTYLAACVFYVSLFDQPSTGIPFHSTLPKEQALALQKVADSVVKKFYNR